MKRPCTPLWVDVQNGVAEAAASPAITRARARGPRRACSTLVGGQHRDDLGGDALGDPDPSPRCAPCRANPEGAGVSLEYQDQLLREAVSKDGSEEDAARWVAAADTSPHVSRDAVDVWHFDATAWLSVHGAWYGLCQI